MNRSHIDRTADQLSDFLVYAPVVEKDVDIQGVYVGRTKIL